ncbi:MAG: hypothetical protein Q9210_004686 [Variospora velana]
MNSPKAGTRFPKVHVSPPKQRTFPDDDPQALIHELDLKIMKLGQHLNAYSREIARQNSEIGRLVSKIQRRDLRIQKRDSKIRRQGKQIQRLALRQQNTGSNSAPKDKVRVPHCACPATSTNLICFEKGQDKRDESFPIQS